MVRKMAAIHGCLWENRDVILIPCMCFRFDFDFKTIFLFTIFFIMNPDTILVDLRPDRDLLDPSFNGYKLSLDSVPIHRKSASKGKKVRLGYFLILHYT